MKTAHWEPSCSMRTDGKLGITKLIIDFRNIENASKNHCFFLLHFVIPVTLSD
jgi:hypothetical protein